MAPSEYIRQMLMSAQERLDYLLKPGRCVNARALLRGAVDSRHFMVSPCVVIFQRFAPGDVYNATLTIRNVSKVHNVVSFPCLLIKTACRASPRLFRSVQYSRAQPRFYFRSVTFKGLAALEDLVRPRSLFLDGTSQLELRQHCGARARSRL